MEAETQHVLKYSAFIGQKRPSAEYIVHQQSAVTPVPDGRAAAPHSLCRLQYFCLCY